MASQLIWDYYRVKLYYEPASEIVPTEFNTVVLDTVTNKMNEGEYRMLVSEIVNDTGFGYYVATIQGLVYADLTEAERFQLGAVEAVPETRVSSLESDFSEVYVHIAEKMDAPVLHEESSEWWTTWGATDANYVKIRLYREIWSEDDPENPDPEFVSEYLSEELIWESAPIWRTEGGKSETEKGSLKLTNKIYEFGIGKYKTTVQPLGLPDMRFTQQGAIVIPVVERLDGVESDFSNVVEAVPARLEYSDIVCLNPKVSSANPFVWFAILGAKMSEGYGNIPSRMNVRITVFDDLGLEVVSYSMEEPVHDFLVSYDKNYIAKGSGNMLISGGIQLESGRKPTTVYVGHKLPVGCNKGINARLDIKASRHFMTIAP